MFSFLRNSWTVFFSNKLYNTTFHSGVIFKKSIAFYGDGRHSWFFTHVLKQIRHWAESRNNLCSILWNKIGRMGQVVKEKLDVEDRVLEIRKHQQESSWSIWREDWELQVAEEGWGQPKVQSLSPGCLLEKLKLFEEWMSRFSGHPLLDPGVVLCNHVISWVWKPIAMRQHTCSLHLGKCQKKEGSCDVTCFPLSNARCIVQPFFSFLLSL